MSFHPIHHSDARAEPYPGLSQGYYGNREIPNGIGEIATTMRSYEEEVRRNCEVAAQSAAESDSFCAQITDNLKAFSEVIWDVIESIISTVKSFFGKGEAVNEGTLRETPLEEFRKGLLYQFESRDQMVAAFYQLPVADRDALKEEMWQQTEEDGQPIPNWADRVIRGEIQLPGEPEPRQDVQEFSDRIGHEDSILAEALEEIIYVQAGISRLPQGELSMEDFQRLLGERNLNRILIFEAVRSLPEEITGGIILEMKNIAIEDLRRENSSLRLNLQTQDEIGDWALRVLFNVVRQRGETVDRPDIVPFVDILAPNSVFLRAVQRVAANSASNS
ncbi:MAG: hypothetical protein KF898_06215 [Parachlamydiales bacterium]|nr:hypothetical protein [Verrucomicrobiota bacterium]MBX3719225.1 hypothetical protein [Candidatus Acheromyda pituitae]